MRALRLEKKGLRGMSVAESFNHDSSASVLSGVVMRRDFVIDGFVFGRTTLKGDDATDVILAMFQRLHRDDISYLLVSGLVISLYNIVDIKRLYNSLQVPVIGISYRNSQGLGTVLKDRFPSSYKSKLAKYDKLGPREKIKLHTSHEVFIRKEGCSTQDATQLLNGLTLQGSLPEPIRIAQMLSRALLAELSF